MIQKRSSNNCNSLNSFSGKKTDSFKIDVNKQCVVLAFTMIIFLICPILGNSQQTEDPSFYEEIDINDQMNPQYAGLDFTDTLSYTLSERFPRYYSESPLIGVFNQKGDRIIIGDGPYLRIWQETNSEFKLIQNLRYGFQIYAVAWASESEIFAVRYFNNIDIYQWSETDKQFQISQQIDNIEIDRFHKQKTLKFSNKDKILVSAQSKTLYILQKSSNDNYLLKQKSLFSFGKIQRCDVSKSANKILCGTDNNELIVFDYTKEHGYVQNKQGADSLGPSEFTYEIYPVFLDEEWALVGAGGFIYKIMINNEVSHPRCNIVQQIPIVMTSWISSVRLSQDQNKVLVMQDNFMGVYISGEQYPYEARFKRFKINSTRKSYGEMSCDGSKLLVFWDDPLKKTELWVMSSAKKTSAEPDSFTHQQKKEDFRNTIATWSTTFPRYKYNGPPVEFDLVS